MFLLVPNPVWWDSLKHYLEKIWIAAFILSYQHYFCGQSPKFLQNNGFLFLFVSPSEPWKLIFLGMVNQAIIGDFFYFFWTKHLKFWVRRHSEVCEKGSVLFAHSKRSKNLVWNDGHFTHSTSNIILT